MDTLRVSRLHAHYRLPADAADAAPRLQRVLRAVLEEGMEHALARSGVPTHEEICIRAVHAPVRLRSKSTDPTLIGTWSVGLADSIQRTILAGGPDVVRYRTRNHALVDLLQGVAAGDFRRAWAWRTLDLWTLGDHPSPAAAGGEAVRALVAHPESVVAAVAGAARAGALPRLAGALPHAGWVEVARAALGASPLSAHGVGRLLSEAALDLPGERAQKRDDGARGHAGIAASDGAPPAPDAVRIARRSGIAGALRTVPVARERTAWILSVLAVLEADPSALQGDGEGASTLVGRVLREATGEGDRPATRRDDPRRARSAPTRRVAADPERGGAPGHPAAAPEGGTATAGTGAPDGVPEAARVAGEDRAATPPRDASAPTAAEGTRDAPGPEADAGDDPGSAAPLAATTEWGGLLFLLHVVDELGLPAEILAAEVFRARSLAWVLHGIAGCLLHLDVADPAAAAFAGVVPGRLPPWDGDDPASPAEEGALDSLSRRVAARAHERLVGRAPSDARAAAATVRACARRRADLYCETGWFDVLLRLDEVVVETRRAGLDLDPGWIPWLGVVVRFVYV